MIYCFYFEIFFNYWFIFNCLVLGKMDEGNLFWYWWKLLLKYEGIYIKCNCLIIIMFCNYFILGLICVINVMDINVIYIV